MINIHELNRRRREKKQRDLDIYKRVLKRCHNRIRLSAHKMGTQCVFTVPQYIAGLPLYSLQDCIRFLKKTLRQNGFKVRNINFDQLYVSWKHVPLGNEDVSRTSHTNHSHSAQRRTRQHTLHPSHPDHPSHRAIPTRSSIQTHPTVPVMSLASSVADLCPPQQNIPPPPYRDINEELIRADAILYGRK